MRIPVIKGVIDRRILLNYRVDPKVLARYLPEPFRPKIQNEHGVAGICLIRLREIRPRLIPAPFGISSENAAHRIAVEWDTPAGVRDGVFIPRRDTSSRVNTLLGGRIFPGEHHHAVFHCAERGDHYEIDMRSDDGTTHVWLQGEVVPALPSQSIFGSLNDASGFFERGSLGYSVTRISQKFDGLELRSFNWSVRPLKIGEVRSSFFDEFARFPRGSATFDCALLMRNIAHEWHGRESLCCTSQTTAT
jgi:Uncharacterized conserved protein (COG2071)